MTLDDLKAAEALLGSPTWGPDAEDCERFTSRYGGALIDIARKALTPVHASDCAVHNEPAMPNGPCDCGASPESLGVSQEAPLHNLEDQSVREGETASFTGRPWAEEPPVPVDLTAGRSIYSLLAAAWFYGGWKAETGAERAMQAIMEAKGWWPIRGEGPLMTMIGRELIQALPQPPLVMDRERVARVIDPEAFVAVEEELDRRCAMYAIPRDNAQLVGWCEGAVQSRESSRKRALAKADAILTLLSEKNNAN